VNQRIRHLTVALIALFGILFVQLSHWQIISGQRLSSDPRNNRVSLREFDRMRGPIVTADGVTVAATSPVDASTPGGSRYRWQRVYPTGDLFANVTGYYTLGFGSTQLERTQSDILSGTSARQQLQSVGELFSDTDTSGSVNLTLRNDLQTVAKRALGAREGSAVVMDPRTGAILAMYSYPSYDPNLVATHDANAANAAFKTLLDDERKPLLANAYQERYMPGSTFKVVTASAGLESGILTPQTIFKNEKSWTPPDTRKPIRNYGGTSCGGDLTDVFARSCNIAFARASVRMGPSIMVNATNKFGFDERIPFDLPSPAASTFGGRAGDFDDSLALLAVHGFGQGGVQVVPLHMAMIASAIANKGVMMTPFVVRDVRDHDGGIIRSTEPQAWKSPVNPTVATAVAHMMVQVVERGTASCCLRLAGGIQAAAKTGTAQLNPVGQTQRSHAWIMAFAPAASPRVAVAVMLKGVNDVISAGTGGRLAGPIAKTLLDAALPVVP
jgi:peptidoglycan glycosyltransferase